MLEDIYKNEIVNAWVEDNEPIDLIEKRYKNISSVVDGMYDFVLSFSYYYTIRRDYGTDRKYTMIEMHILTDIYDHENITVSALAKKWNRTSSAISQIVHRLIKWGLVYKEVNESDGKVFFLRTTEKAKETVLKHKAYDNKDNVKTRKKLLESFTVDEMVAFDKILKAYTRILEKNNSKNKPL
ncbi:MarR family transcriptional regulator [Treponema sp. OMZ 792]|uniref:MarR family transcriptional regulator n=1 Tax=unclassified Treponema TaxID=2638727 RepID=UPI0020A2C304|nr:MULTISPECIES: MarR family transcriptional regulator [unclassified Treponema]UTC76087.1 MarR family transcriptional regulator [Treponema sp. OMZ 792]UTC80088.1 MarR family transcriptional regulator [Treponema sp. OMZ 798]